MTITTLGIYPDMKPLPTTHLVFQVGLQRNFNFGILMRMEIERD